MPAAEDKRDEDKVKDGNVPVEHARVKRKPFDVFVFYFEIILVVFLAVGFTIWEIWDLFLWPFFK